MDKEPTWPILPYCLFHGSPMLPCVNNGEYELSCVRCVKDEVIHDAERKTISFPLSEDEYNTYCKIVEQMEQDHLPNMTL